MSNSLILDEGTDVSLGNPPDREVNPSPTQPKTLQQEFSLINVNMPNVQMDVVRLSLVCCYFVLRVRDQILLETKDIPIMNKIRNPSLLYLYIESDVSIFLGAVNKIIETVVGFMSEVLGFFILVS